jgi:hypothetical protein
MKCYVLLPPVVSPALPSFIETLRNTKISYQSYDRSDVLRLLNKEVTVKLFMDENIAIEYAKSLSKPTRRPEVSGTAIPVLTVDLNDDEMAALKSVQLIKDKYMGFDGDPHIEKVNPVSVKIECYEVAKDTIRQDALIKAAFCGEGCQIKELDLRPAKISCLIL